MERLLVVLDDADALDDDGDESYLNLEIFLARVSRTTETVIGYEDKEADSLIQ